MKYATERDVKFSKSLTAAERQVETCDKIRHMGDHVCSVYPDALCR